MQCRCAVVVLACSLLLWSAGYPAPAADQSSNGGGTVTLPESLNFPHALFTDKAFPENEIGLVPTMGAGQHRQDWITTLAVDQRVGARSAWSVSLPYRITNRRAGKTTHRLGEIGLGYKHVLWAYQDIAISSASLQIFLPSGGRDRALGYGSVKFAPSLLAGMKVRNLILQSQVQAIRSRGASSQAPASTPTSS